MYILVCINLVASYWYTKIPLLNDKQSKMREKSNWNEFAWKLKRVVNFPFAFIHRPTADSRCLRELFVNIVFLDFSKHIFPSIRLILISYLFSCNFAVYSGGVERCCGSAMWFADRVDRKRVPNNPKPRVSVDVRSIGNQVLLHSGCPVVLQALR